MISLKLQPSLKNLRHFMQVVRLQLSLIGRLDNLEESAGSLSLVHRFIRFRRWSSDAVEKSKLSWCILGADVWLESISNTFVVDNASFNDLDGRLTATMARS
mmetsp:Transcript_13577/g.16225  ORF Transcript_13577/g.16225 Transcript_13577/m.16225 type:complete len:102 (-) Transcript_13577:391-696(-)